MAQETLADIQFFCELLLCAAVMDTELMDMHSALFRVVVQMKIPNLRFLW